MNNDVKHFFFKELYTLNRFSPSLFHLEITIDSDERKDMSESKGKKKLFRKETEKRRREMLMKMMMMRDGRDMKLINSSLQVPTWR